MDMDMEYKTVENEKLYLDINNFINAEFFEEPRGTYNTKASYAC